MTNRRGFFAWLAGLAGSAGVVGVGAPPAKSDPRSSHVHLPGKELCPFVEYCPWKDQVYYKDADGMWKLSPLDAPLSEHLRRLDEKAESLTIQWDHGRIAAMFKMTYGPRGFERVDILPYPSKTP